MTMPEPIELCRGDHGEMTPRDMADADLLRFGLGSTALKLGTSGDYTESHRYLFAERPDELLLDANVIWQSDDIWE